MATPPINPPLRPPTKPPPRRTSAGPPNGGHRVGAAAEHFVAVPDPEGGGDGAFAIHLHLGACLLRPRRSRSLARGRRWWGAVAAAAGQAEGKEQQPGQARVVGHGIIVTFSTVLRPFQYINAVISIISKNRRFGTWRNQRPFSGQFSNNFGNLSKKIGFVCLLSR